MSADELATSWWGRAWVERLASGAGLDEARLPRGRTLLRQGRVARLELERGRITALVRGSRALPYRVTITARTATDAQWDQVAAALAGHAGRAAALLDGELDPAVAEEAAALGVALLPGPGDLSLRCSCPDPAVPCPHAAATALAVGARLDDDPFALLRLRGTTGDALIERVRAHRSGTGAGPSGRQVAAVFGGGDVVDPGVPAREAWASAPTPLPERRALPPAAGAPAPWPSDPPRDAPFTAAGMRELATDAVRRAHAQLADGASSALDLDATADLARRAADRLDQHDELHALARRAGTPVDQLAHLGLAWRSAGAEGLAVVDEERWLPPTAVLERGLDALDAAGVDEAEVQVRSNRLTAGDVQLRVSRDLRWWRFERRGRAWELVEPPADDPLDLVDT